jgi:multiple antibiotic resistance protein
MVTVDELKLTHEEQVSAEEIPEEHWKTLAVVPLAIPGTVGAGTITTVVVAATTYSTLMDLAIITAVCGGTALIMWLTYRSAGPIARRLGPIGLNVVTRVMGNPRQRDRLRPARPGHRRPAARTGAIVRRGGSLCHVPTDR